MKENWLALCVAILNRRPLSIEKAFEKYENGQVSRALRWKKEDLEDCYKLRKQGLSLTELSEIYGSNNSTICRQLAKYKEKHKKRATTK